jgi:hypothetical protein
MIARMFLLGQSAFLILGCSDGIDTSELTPSRIPDIWLAAAKDCIREQVLAGNPSFDASTDIPDDSRLDQLRFTGYRGSGTLYVDIGYSNPFFDAPSAGCLFSTSTGEILNLSFEIGGQYTTHDVAETIDEVVPISELPQ